jgi:hypothetical protein
MIRSPEALCMDLVDILGPGRTRREPFVFASTFNRPFFSLPFMGVSSSQSALKTCLGT